MAYGCGYADGYNDFCEIVVDVCAPIGYGGGPYGLLAYAGYELCSEDAANQELSTPKSNVRNLCSVRCN